MSLNLALGLPILTLTSYMILVALETILAGNYQFLIYQNVCICKLGLCSTNTRARLLKCISLEGTGHKHPDKVSTICAFAILKHDMSYYVKIFI